MDDLISRSAILREAKSIGNHLFSDWESAGVYALIGRQPTVDAVPVVRCRECRHFVQGQHLDLCAMSWYGRGGDADCFSKIVHDADKEYCIYGERKEPADGRTD